MGRPSTTERVQKREALGGFSLAKSPQTPQMRLKHGAFRHLRMAAKGSALRTRRLLKKAGENFLIAGGSAAAKGAPNGREVAAGPAPPTF